MMVGTFSLLLNISKFNAPSLFFSQPNPPSPSASTSTLRIPFSMAMPVPHSSSSSSTTTTTATATRIAIVGDVHDDWDLEADAEALQFLQPDLVFFTGDFGNENVELVRSISKLKMAKAVILGNHDCVFTRQFSQKMKDGVQLQLECLGEDHVGYKRLDFPKLKLSVVGGRPFSHGGKHLNRKDLLAVRYGVHNTEESVERIYAAARGAPENHFLIFLAHNGPTGLGSNMDDICGKDWVYGGGDHGDADLAQALSKLKETTSYSIPLVIFGHMHKGLAYGGLRKMLVIGADGIMYLNGAVVPRVKYASSGSSIRAFTVVEFAGSEVNKVAETWVSVNDKTATLEEEYVLLRREAEVSCCSGL